MLSRARASAASLFLLSCGPPDVARIEIDAAGPSPDGASTVDAPPLADADPTAPDAAVGPDAAIGPDPGLAGSYATGTRPVSIVGVHDFDATVVYPESGGSIAPGPFPLVILSHDGGFTRGDYGSYATHLASWGYIVVLPDHAGMTAQEGAEQVSQVIDWSTTAGSGVVGSLAAGKVAACGHGVGAQMGLLAAVPDFRIDAVVAWDPIDSGTPAVIPSLASVMAKTAYLGETLDAAICVPAALSFTAFYAATSSPSLSVDVKNADHRDFPDDPSCSGCEVCASGTADPAWVRQLTKRTTVAWFRRTLDGDMSMDAYLTGAVMLADETAGRVAVESK